MVRLAGLAVLGSSVTKVFLLDLATLTSLYRVVSFIGLGLLLLVGAFIWQRLRPAALSDLRERPPESAGSHACSIEGLRRAAPTLVHFCITCV